MPARPLRAVCQQAQGLAPGVGCAPAADNLSLVPAYCDVVADDDELDLIRLARVQRSVLFLCETKVQDIAGVVPDRLGSADQPGWEAILTHLTMMTVPASLSTRLIPRSTCAGFGEAKTLPHTAARKGYGVSLAARELLALIARTCEHALA